MAARASLCEAPAFLSTAYHHRELILLLAKREVLSRYRGSILGLAWAFFTPVLMLSVYTFVFSVVFKARWGAGGDNKTEFAMLVFVGLIVHGFFAECVTRAPFLILSNASYVKKIVFPLEVLPWVAVSSALFHTLVSVMVLAIAQLVIQHSVPWTIIYLPLLFAPLVLGTIGLAWFIASIGVYVRDIGQTVGILTTVLLFMSPVFYPLSALPQHYQPLLLLNPLTFIIEQARQILIWGQQPDWGGTLVYTAASLAVASLGFWWFQKTRSGFADVL